MGCGVVDDEVEVAVFIIVSKLLSSGRILCSSGTVNSGCLTGADWITSIDTILSCSRSSTLRKLVDGAALNRGLWERVDGTGHVCRLFPIFSVVLLCLSDTALWLSCGISNGDSGGDCRSFAAVVFPSLSDFLIVDLKFNGGGGIRDGCGGLGAAVLGDGSLLTVLV